MALQEDKYHGYVESLDAMLVAYRGVVGSLAPVEAELLQEQIREMRSALAKGFTLLNWSSLSIPEFVDSCGKAIARFGAVVKTIGKNVGIIGGVVSAIGIRLGFPMEMCEGSVRFGPRRGADVGL